jgi:hypothetical protein
MPLACEVMAMLFTENAANSSLQSRWKAALGPAGWNRPQNPMLAPRSWSSHNPRLGHLRRA